MQTKALNLNVANTLISACYNEINDLRSNESFSKVLDEAKVLCEHICEFECAFTKRMRIGKKKRFQDEIREDSPIEDANQKFKINIYLVILDTIAQQIKTRFSDFQNTGHMFNILNPANFRNCDTITEEEKGHINALVSFYEGDIINTSSTVVEFESFKSFFIQNFRTSGVNNEPEINIDNIVTFMLANQLHEIYPNLTTLYKIFLTIPISSASAEHSFSRLKLIKTCLRSQMGEGWLSNLAISSIERRYI